MYNYLFTASNPENVDDSIMLSSYEKYSKEEFAEICEKVLVEFYKYCEKIGEAYPSVSSFTKHRTSLLLIFSKYNLVTNFSLWEASYDLEPYFGLDKIKNEKLKDLIKAACL